MLTLFAFAPNQFSDGKLVTGYDKVTWLERYSSAGEFKIEGYIGSGLLEQLPLGSFVSHSDTLDIMIVEDHAISDSIEGETRVEVSGRSLMVLLEQRTIGINQNWDAGYKNVSELAVAPNYSWNQIVQIINTHIRVGFTQNPEDAIEGVSAVSAVTGVSESVRRVLNRSTVYSIVLDLLKVDDVGLRTVRKHSFASNSPIGPSDTTHFLVHQGRDMRNKVEFSSEDGGVDSSEYLWTQRVKKNAAIVVGGTFEVLVEGQSPPATGFDRRIMSVDGKEIDKSYDENMSAAQVNEIIQSMVTFGKQAMAKQKDIGLASVDISRNNIYRYRHDYDIGDLVSVKGTYGPEEVMRVTEHVEIEDKDEFIAYPTLSLI